MSFTILFFYQYYKTNKLQDLYYVQPRVNFNCITAIIDIADTIHVYVGFPTLCHDW